MAWKEQVSLMFCILSVYSQDGKTLSVDKTDRYLQYRKEGDIPYIL
jgi:hypothetical protein